ncbi:MAG: helix-turn-helix transcriptional regulator [Chloroflexales bacterium]|nr:helix-turn-helix transcriptional regulator [Chloroflexales bacterium]
MSNLFARCIGLGDEPPISMDAAILLIERKTPLSRSEARVVILDYLGWPRDQLCEHLGVSVETIRTYWKRIRQKTKCRRRAAVRAWVESILAQAVEGEAGT